MAFGLPPRSQRHRLVAGVAGGLAEGLELNVVALRIIWLFLFLPGGAPGLLLYIAFWLLMPEPDTVS